MSLAHPDHRFAPPHCTPPQHVVVESTLDRRALGALLASDYGHVPVATLAEPDVRLANEPPGRMTAVAASVRLSGVRQPLIVRVRPDGVRVLLDGHHRAVAVLRRNLANSVPALLVTCPCTMGCAFTAELLAEYRERAAADGWAA